LSSHPQSQRLLLLLGLMPATLLAIWFGVQERVTPLSVSALIVDRSLQLTSVLVFLGLVTLVVSFASPRFSNALMTSIRWFVALSYMAGLYMSFILLMVSVLRLWEAPSGRALLMGILSLAGTVIGAYFVVAFSRALRLPKNVLAAVLVPTFLLSTFQFWHQAIFVPSNLNASLGIEPTVDFAPSKDGLNQATATVRLSNTSTVSTLVIISVLRVCPEMGWSDSFPAISASTEGCWTSRPFLEATSLEPESELLYQRSLELDSGHVLVRAQTRVAYARADRLILQDAIEKPRVEGCTIDTLYPIRPESQYRTLLASRMALAFGPDGSGGSRFWVTELEALSCDGDRLAGERFGIQTPTIYSEHWVMDTGAIAGESD
jgi:hypothetical protein